MANTEILVPGKSLNKAVKTELFDTLRKELTEPKGKSKKSFVQDYVQIMLKEAKSNPNGPIGNLIARQLLQEDIIASLDAETDKYLARDNDFNEYRLLKTLYKEQQAVFCDPASKIIVIGSRRIGKTELSARLLVRDILKPNHHALYINTNFENAVNQCYGKVIKLLETLGIPIEEKHKNEGWLKLYNGSDVYFKGNADKSQADKRQGYGYSCVVIDEVQSQCNLPYLMDTILKPALADYEDSKLICIGTPPRIPHTRAEAIWKEYEGWSKYNWDMTKNPYIKNPRQLILEICQEKHCTEDAPFIQREWKGQFVYDKESQVFKDSLIYVGGNEFVLEQIRSGKFKADYIYGGVDFGFSDYNAIVTIAWDKERNMGYVLDNYKFNKATVTVIVEKMKISLAEAQEILIASNTDPHNVMYYGDNSDKSIIFELSVNYNFPIQCAYKHDKMEALSALSEMSRRFIYTPKDSPLEDEYEMLVYKRDQETDAILPELDDDVFHGDASMAYLYASRSLVLDHNPLGKEDGADINEKKLPDPEEDESYLTPDDTMRDGMQESW